MKIHLPAIGPDLPTHPATGLRAIGMSKRGPIWPIFGASDDDPEGDPDDDDPEGDPEGGDPEGDPEGGDPEGADKLGDGGKKALDTMKGRWHTERDRRKVAEAEVAKLKAGPAKQGADDKPDAEAIREQARTEARAEATRERVLDKIEAKAAKRFEDPEDAVALLGRKVDDFIDGGQVDVDAIVEALDDLLKRKPHLGVSSGDKSKGGKGGLKPDLTQGTRGGGSAKADLETQIAEAQKAGDVMKVIRLQNQKLETAKPK